MKAFKNASALLVMTVTSLAMSSAVSANELLITPAQGKAANPAIALDIMSDGNVSGFQFALDFGKAKLAKVDVSRCLSELPSSFSGKCQQVGSKVYVIAMANQMTSLPAGMIPVGSIVAFAQAESKAGGSQKQRFVVTDLEFVDVKGGVLQTKSKVSE
ncbi:MAG: hypothetical protein AB7D30_04675 [Lysobacteraceae bacterium]